MGCSTFSWVRPRFGGFGAAGASHDNPRTPNVHISGPRRFKHHQNSTKGPQKERKKKENCGGRGKKERNFGLSTLVGSTLVGSTLRGLTVRGPTLRRRVGLKRHWPEQVRPKQVNTFTGLNRSGLNRSNWPKAVLALSGLA